MTAAGSVQSPHYVDLDKQTNLLYWVGELVHQEVKQLELVFPPALQKPKIFMCNFQLLISFLISLLVCGHGLVDNLLVHFGTPPSRGDGSSGARIIPDKCCTSLPSQGTSAPVPKIFSAELNGTQVCPIILGLDTPSPPPAEVLEHLLMSWFPHLDRAVWSRISCYSSWLDISRQGRRNLFCLRCGEGKGPTELRDSKTAKLRWETLFFLPLKRKSNLRRLARKCRFLTDTQDQDMSIKIPRIKLVRSCVAKLVSMDDAW